MDWGSFFSFFMMSQESRTLSFAFIRSINVLTTFSLPELPNWWATREDGISSFKTFLSAPIYTLKMKNEMIVVYSPHWAGAQHSTYRISTNSIQSQSPIPLMWESDKADTLLRSDTSKVYFLQSVPCIQKINYCRFHSAKNACKPWDKKLEYCLNPCCNKIIGRSTSNPSNLRNKW